MIISVFIPCSVICCDVSEEHASVFGGWGGANLVLVDAEVYGSRKYFDHTGTFQAFAHSDM